MAGKGSDRRDNFRAFNGGLYFWLQENQGFTRSKNTCPECGKWLYVNTDIRLGCKPPKVKMKCQCGFEEWWEYIS